MSFGTRFVATMSVARWKEGVWTEPALEPVAPLSLHPATHALHYASACFEGLKAHRGVDGAVRIFRPDRHAERMGRSAAGLLLPPPPPHVLLDMIRSTVAANREAVPEPPGSLYLRPTLIGTDPNIGGAVSPSAEALLYVLASPVGSYLANRPLRLALETEQLRTTPRFGMVKAGANYALALGVTMEARRRLGVDQVLFASNGRVEETAASNFLLLDPERVVTPALTESFLHGVTRDSLLRLASDLGYVVEERPLTVEDLVEWIARPEAEAALSGTAVVLAGVGTIVHRGEELAVGSGEVGPHTTRLRTALTDLHVGRATDRYGWLMEV